MKQVLIVIGLFLIWFLLIVSRGYPMSAPIWTPPLNPYGVYQYNFKVDTEIVELGIVKPLEQINSRIDRDIKTIKHIARSI